MITNLRIYQIAGIWTKSPEALDYTHWANRKVRTCPTPDSYLIEYFRDTELLVDELITYTYHPDPSLDLIIAKTTTVRWYDITNAVGYTKVFTKSAVDELGAIIDKDLLVDFGIEKRTRRLNAAKVDLFMSVGEVNTKEFLVDVIWQLDLYIHYESNHLIIQIQDSTRAYMEWNVSDTIIPGNSTATPPVKVRAHLISILS